VLLIFRLFGNLTFSGLIGRIQKATVAWPMVKPAPFGLPYSFADIRSSYLDEGIAVMMYTPSYRVSDEHWPVYMANRYYYQLGPFSADAGTVRNNFYPVSNDVQLIGTNFLGLLVELQHVRSLAEHLRQTFRPSDQQIRICFLWQSP
jgi:hypothetical protein